METFDKQYLLELAHKYKMGTLTETEQAYYDRWYDSKAMDTLELPDDFAAELTEVRERMESNIYARTGIGRNAEIPRTIQLWHKMAAAAVVLIFAGALFFYSRYHSRNDNLADLKPHPTYIAPGSNKAILTLANGKKVILDKKSNGIIATQDGVQLQNSSAGKLIYSKNGIADNAALIAFNTVETPRGGKYELQLPDGTQVWLNASSSLRYPVAFGKKREVELTGEAYFEVVHNSKSPFIVKTTAQQVRDLGTQFNVNAYTDEPETATTLVKGSVIVTSTNSRNLLKPGQQTINRAGSLTVSEADIRTAIAWREGQIAFHHTNIKAVLRQVSRWYNIDIAYQGQVPDFTISGRISRQTDLSAMLKILELNGVHFVQQGRKLVIINEALIIK